MALTNALSYTASALLPNWLPEKPSRIAVAMSGGVDSSVVAWLLAKAGHDVVGLTAWTLNGPGACCNDALVNAGRVCEDLGCDFDTVDLRAEFSHYVMDYYQKSYLKGLTPNPCVECNRYVKWELLLKYATEQLGVDYVATGHYVRLQKSERGTHVLRARDPRKDQTYMLSRVLQPDIARAIFPLGNWIKPDVVALAKEVGIPTAYSKESMDVCFVLDGQANYLTQTLGTTPGSIVDIDTGKVVGHHEGYYFFTVGQRKGVKVAAGRPVYVVKTEASTNTVYIGDAHHLEASSLEAFDINWLQVPPTLHTEGGFASMVKFRYNTPPQKAWVAPLVEGSTRFRVTFEKPVQAVTKGQIAAFYCPDDRELYGGGFIEEAISHVPFDPETAPEPPDLWENCPVPSSV
ncbi:MAG: tRNA 2-thiouridine(34) synthase MnmA [Vampirovibrionales bacterium]